MNPPARSADRAVFALAALYNLAFGLWAVFFPEAFFQVFELEAPRYPAIWSCLGMVVGLYAVAYAAIAIAPDRGALLAAIGLAGKVLGPLGWLWSVRTGELPARTFPLVLANDLVWWYPFLAYLLRNRPHRRSIVAGAALAANAAASLGLLLVAAGTESEPELARRAGFLAGHPALWSGVWLLWVLASTGLVAFFVQWSAKLVEEGAGAGIAWFGTFLVALGAVFDLVGETVQIAFLTREGLASGDFERLARLYTLLGPGTANGLYCAGGLVLAALSWRHRLVRGPLGCLGFAVWSVGLILTGGALAGAREVMVVSGAAVMALFLAWGSALALRLDP